MYYNVKEGEDVMKTRIISAIIMLLITVPILIKGGELFAIFILIIAICGLKEIIDLRETKKKIPDMIKLLAYVALTVLIIGQFSSDIMVYAIDYRLIALTLFTLLIPIILYHDVDTYNINDSMFMIGVLFFLGTTFSLVVLIRDYSLMYLLFLIIIAIASDTYAYLIGTLIGKHKLLESVSPNKSVEGTIFGIIFGTILGTMFYYMVISNTVNIIILILTVMLLSIVGQLGDLCFSAIKRKYKKKDFSSLIPGHGGILDRLDSIIFIVLIFSLFINII